MRKSLITISAAIILGIEAILAPLNTENVAVSHQGYAPAANQPVVVYTDADPGPVQVLAEDGRTIDSLNLEQRVCQGGQTCFVGQMDISQPGKYKVRTANGSASVVFPVDYRVYDRTADVFMEYYAATAQQGSPYHAPHHMAQNPPFIIMADGSFIMEANMASTALMWLNMAYLENESLFENKYNFNMDAPDILEYIMMHADTLALYQDQNDNPSVAKGWNNNFSCPWYFTPYEGKWNDEPNPCMTFIHDTDDLFTAQATFGFAGASQALRSFNATKAQAYMQRAEQTVRYLQGRTLDANQTAFLGAALFRLADMTGNGDYIVQAHALKERVDRELIPTETLGSVFYWDEYIKHEESLLGRGLEYTVDGRHPRWIFDEHVMDDYNNNISKTGEHVFQLDPNIQFHNSRFMLLQANYNILAARHTSSQDVREIGLKVADSQMAWLSGMNQVIYKGTPSSRVFIYGVGDRSYDTGPFHSRLVPTDFHDPGNTMTFLNGSKIIPGWISGAFDSNQDNDEIWEHPGTLDFRYSETTGEIVAAAAAYMSLRSNTSSLDPATLDNHVYAPLVVNRHD